MLMMKFCGMKFSEMKFSEMKFSEMKFSEQKSLENKEEKPRGGRYHLKYPPSRHHDGQSQI
jgi:hypothetical protein